MKITVFLICFLLLFMANFCNALDFHEVRVMNSDAVEVDTVEDPKSLLDLKSLWQSKVAVNTLIEPRWEYTLHFPGGEVWTCSSDGYLKEVSSHSSLIYLVSDIEKLNQLLSIKRPGKK